MAFIAATTAGIFLLQGRIISTRVSSTCSSLPTCPMWGLAHQGGEAQPAGGIGTVAVSAGVPPHPASPWLLATFLSSASGVNGHYFNIVLLGDFRRLSFLQDSISARASLTRPQSNPGLVWAQRSPLQGGWPLAGVPRSTLLGVENRRVMGGINCAPFWNCLFHPPGRWRPGREPPAHFHPLGEPPATRCYPAHLPGKGANRLKTVDCTDGCHAFPSSIPVSARRITWRYSPPPRPLFPMIFSSPSARSGQVGGYPLK